MDDLNQHPVQGRDDQGQEERRPRRSMDDNQVASNQSSPQESGSNTRDPNNSDLLNSSNILPAAHGMLSIASLATRFGLKIAKKSVKFGFAVPQTIISNVIPSQLSPISTVILSSLTLAEFSTLTALQLAQGITTTSLDLASISISELDSLIKSYQLTQPSLPSIDALKFFLILIRQHWDKINTPHADDLPPQVEPFKFFIALRAISTWALLQQLTRHIYDNQFVSSCLIPIQHDTDSHLNLTQPDRLDHPGIVKLRFKRYIDLCLSSYGGLGHVLFGSNGKLSSSKYTEEGSVVEKSSSSINVAGMEANQALPRNLRAWDLILGKHDQELMRQHGELITELEVDEPLNEEDAQIAKELQDLLPARPLESNWSEEPENEGCPSSPNGKPINENNDLTDSWIDSIEEIDSGSATIENQTPNWDTITDAENDQSSSNCVGEEQSTPGRLSPESNNRAPDSKSARTVPLSQEQAIPPSCQPPRYFILLDKANGTVIVALRGTFSLGDIITDLTCDHQTFDPQLFWDQPCWQDDNQLDLNSSMITDDPQTNRKRQYFQVHKGFLQVAQKLIGTQSSPSEPNKTQVRRQTKFMKTLTSLLGSNHSNGSTERTTDDHNSTTRKTKYQRIEFVGHSLGAGVAILLALMLADPRTGLSTKLGGLPEGTAVRVYAICPPCTTSRALTELSRNMVKTLINSNDLVSRLSLNHILNLKTLISWIEFYESHPDQIVSASKSSQHDRRVGIWKNLLEIFTRLKFIQSKYNLDNKGDPAQDVNDEQMKIDKEILLKDELWLVEMRNLLESKIQKDHQVDVLLPTGEIYWIFQDRLFLVKELKCQDIFSRIEFDFNMIKDHLIHQVKTKFETCL